MSTTTTQDVIEQDQLLDSIVERYDELGMVSDGRLYAVASQFDEESGSEISTEHDLEEIVALALKKGLPEDKVRAEGFADRLITFTASDDSQDRYGDRITVDGKLGRRTFGDGWKLENFERNPVFMPFHSYDRLPLGTAIKTWKDVRSGRRKRLRMTVAMDDGSSNPAAPLITNAYKSGLMRSVSVGFRPLKFHEPSDDDERIELGLGPRGVVFGEQELYENSAVAIPANPNAVAEKSVNCSDMKCFLRFADELREVDPEFGYQVRSVIRKNIGQVYLNKLEKDIEERTMSDTTTDVSTDTKPADEKLKELDERIEKLESVAERLQDIAEGLDSHLAAFSSSDSQAPAASASRANGHVIEEMLEITKQASGLFGNDAEPDKEN